MAKLWMFVAGLSGFLAVAIGAFGSHALEANLSPSDFENFQIGSQYHLIHSLALFGVALLAARGTPMASIAGMAFVSGILLFSGSLYLLSIVPGVAMAAPFGGASFMIGWITLMVVAFRQPVTSNIQ